jgi:Fe2+ or Zn2+ uptake regulation protein
MNTGSHPPRSLVEQFSARGYRLTAQRRTLLEIIEMSKEPLDAAALLKLAQARDRAIDRATVYRTLELLKKCNMRRGENELRLACSICGDFADPGSRFFERLRKEIVHEMGFHISFIRIEAAGRCGKCVRSAGSSE